MVAKRRKTAAEVREARAQLERRAYDVFMLELKALTSFREAWSWVARSPDGSPARKYYANLGFFLHTYSAPDGASSAELSEYIRLIGCFDAEGAVKPGLRKGIEEALRTAQSSRY